MPDATETPDWPPARPARWVGVTRSALFAGLLLAAGYLRFDAGAPWAGRAVVAAAWALAGLGVWRVFRRTRPMVDRQMATPGGLEAFYEWERARRRVEWEAHTRRGPRAYVLRTAAWVGPLLLAALYSCAALAPTALLADGAGASPGGPPRFLLWLLVLGALAGALAAWVGRRWWRRAERGWAAEPPAPPA